MGKKPRKSQGRTRCCRGYLLAPQPAEDAKSVIYTDNNHVGSCGDQVLHRESRTLTVLVAASVDKQYHRQSPAAAAHLLRWQWPWCEYVQEEALFHLLARSTWYERRADVFPRGDRLRRLPSHDVAEGNVAESAAGQLLAEARREIFHFALDRAAGGHDHRRVAEVTTVGRGHGG
jgi:hypothetical protein